MVYRALCFVVDRRSILVWLTNAKHITSGTFEEKERCAMHLTALRKRTTGQFCCLLKTADYTLSFSQKSVSMLMWVELKNNASKLFICECKLLWITRLKKKWFYQTYTFCYFLLFLWAEIFIAAHYISINLYLPKTFIFWIASVY